MRTCNKPRKFKTEYGTRGKSVAVLKDQAGKTNVGIAFRKPEHTSKRNITIVSREEFNKTSSNGYQDALMDAKLLAYQSGRTAEQIVEDIKDWIETNET